MVLIALSFQDQVEKYGAYVGIAAFFGLAVLSLLYFSQARELKRLREWAGRAPERARELEQRVVAQATATATRRAPAMPAKGGIAPPRRLAEMPVPPPGAQTAAGAQATELADAVKEEPATNGNVPAAPAPGAANGTAPAAEGAEAAESEPSADGAGRPGAAAEEPARAGEATEAGGGEAVEAGGGEAVEAGGGEAVGDAVEAGGDEAAGEPVEAGDAEAPAPADEAGKVAPGTAAGAAAAGAGAAASVAGDGQAAVPGEAPAAGEQAEGDDGRTRPGEIPAAVPRATPAQRVGVAPRPAPMPLRQDRPSATPRRPGTAAPRRPGGAPREGRSAGTIALLVGIAVLILGGGVFVISQLDGDDTPPEPNRAAPPPTQTATGGGSRKTPAETNVAVLNGTTFTGLAGQLADRVSQEGGFERGATETNTRDQTIQASTVYYADGFRSQARAVARLLSISDLEPLDADTQALAPDADVVVLAGADQAP